MVGMGDMPASFLFRVTKEDRSLPCSPVSLMAAFPQSQAEATSQKFPFRVQPRALSPLGLPFSWEWGCLNCFL